MNVDRPAAWPPNSRFGNSAVWGKGAIRNINMGTLSKTVEIFNDLLILGWVLT